MEDTGRVGIEHLEILAVDDAHDAVARGLGLAGDDTESLSDEGVHEGGLADIGVADYIDETGTVRMFCHS